MMLLAQASGCPPCCQASIAHLSLVSSCAPPIGYPSKERRGGGGGGGGGAAVPPPDIMVLAVKACHVQKV